MTPRATIVLLSLVVLASTAPAAQDEHPWVSTDWAVYCTSRMADSLDVADCDDTNTVGPAAAWRASLEDASAWLRGLGFRGPDHETIGDTYAARLSDREHEDEHGDRRALGVYYLTERQIYLTSDTFFAMGRGDTDAAAEQSLAQNIRVMGTAVHELFHAVEHRYHKGDTYNGRERDWIWEGMADAVAASWLRKAMPAERISAGTRAFDAPLHQPATRLDTYRTYCFWRGVGRLLGSEDDVAYLHRVLEADLAPDLGLSGVDEALGTLIGATAGVDEALGEPVEPTTGGLYTLYPTFIARFADHPAHYSSVETTRLQYRSRPHSQGVPGAVRPVAASAHYVVVDVPAGEAAALEIAVGADHEDLHLVVGRSRLDLVTPEAEGERNVFRTFVNGTGRPDTFFVRVVNVAPKAVDSRDQEYVLDLSLRPLDAGFAAVAGGDVAARFQGEPAVGGLPRRDGTCWVTVSLPFGPVGADLYERFRPGSAVLHVSLDGEPEAGRSYPVLPNYRDGARFDRAGAVLPLIDEGRMPAEPSRAAYGSLSLPAEHGRDRSRSTFLSRGGTVTVDGYDGRSLRLRFDVDFVEQEPERSMTDGSSLSRRAVTLSGAVVHDLELPTRLLLNPREEWGCGQ